MTKRLEISAVLSRAWAWKPENLQSKKDKTHISQKSIHNYIGIIRSCIDTENTKRDGREDNFSAQLCHPNVFDRGYYLIFIG
jgi:hypothetical protein